MVRLPDHDLTVLVDRGARGSWEAQVATRGGKPWGDLTGEQQNSVREAALPFIFHGTQALAELGYRKPRTITTVEELDALPVGTVLLDDLGLALQKHRVLGTWTCINGERGLTGENVADEGFPATVLYEPEAHHDD